MEGVSDPGYFFGNHNEPFDLSRFHPPPPPNYQPAMAGIKKKTFLLMKYIQSSSKLGTGTADPG